MDITQEEADAMSIFEGAIQYTGMVGEGDDCCEEGGADNCLEEGIIINGLVDILNIDLKNIRNEDVSRYDFGDLQAAYLFYTWYARMNGFSVRKSKVVRNSKGEMLQQTFVCSREGYREDTGVTMERRRREPRHETRCGCQAKFRVHINVQSRRWYVTLFTYEHNHELLEERYCALLPAHRKLTVADILQIDNFRRAGIRPTHMFGSFANNSGGYEKIGFRIKDLYNQVGRQKRMMFSDASGALKFLRDLSSKDPLMYVRHLVDNEGRLQHLFWCDGESQMNYQVFGDVLAFDATYGRNKYMCPLVVFSGVNHHNQTIVFATGLVSNETEETYVWLLQQFMDVMKGKAPSSVITDGDLAMKNAIHRIFPEAHHRLCAWHLLRNASSKVGIPDSMPYLKRCMLGDYDVVQFEEMWGEMVTKFGLEDNNWITEMYQKRKMWATAVIRGNFFAGIRTTSRCEALHSHIGKFVHRKMSLVDFVEQYHRCLTYFRFREVEADFESDYGEVVLQTSLRSLERSAAKQFTKEIFILFRPVLMRASLVRVMECQEMSMYSIYSVSKYRSGGTVWHVSYCPSPVEFRCSCLRMESIGMPCEHIVAVLVYLDFSELPNCLVLDRWSKRAKESIRGRYVDGSFYWDSHLIARYATLHYLFREIVELAYREEEDYKHIVDLLTCELNKLRLKHRNRNGASVQNAETETSIEAVHDPPIVRTKGCGATAENGQGRSRRASKCRICGISGHNRRSCPTARQDREAGPPTCAFSFMGDESGAQEEDNDFNTQLMQEQPETFIPSTSYAVDGV